MLEVHREKAGRLAELLDELGALCEAAGAEALARRIREEQAEKLRRGRFHLVVVGEFNHGKSTFVNALLETRVLPVGVTPTTAAIHHIAYGPTPRLTVVTEGGAREELAVQSLERFTVEGSCDAGGVAYLEVELPAELLRDGVVIVDTPGVNDLSLTRAEVTYGYVPRADAVLFVLDAGQPVKESERRFLQEQLLARSRDKILFVVAKADLWGDDEREGALAWIEARLAELVEHPRVFPVSAARALAGGRAASGLPELVAELESFLVAERGRIVLGNAVGEGRSAARLLERGLAARLRTAELDVEQLDQRIALLERDLAGQAGTVEERRLTLREEAGSIKAWARRDLDRLVDDVLARLPAVVESSSGSDVREHLGPWLERAFAEWAEAETREITAALSALAERTLALAERDAEASGRRLGEALGTELKAPAVRVDTFAYDVSVFAMLSLGLVTVFANALLGGVLLAAAPALALWSKGRTEAELKRRALELAPVALREAASRVAPRMDELVDGFVAELTRWVVSASEELHLEILQMLRALREERAQGAVDAHGIRVGTEGLVARLRAWEARLDELEGSMVPAVAPATPVE